MRALFVILLIVLSLPSVAVTVPHPLLSYVQQQDDAFRWEKKATITGEGYTAHVIDLHSQHWMTLDDVDRTEWQHWLTIVVPDKVLHDKALLLIQHRNNSDKAPTEVDAIMTTIALATNSVVAGISQVPNQPLVFKADPEAKPRTEDDLIAFAWTRFFETRNPVWLPRFPMVKATVRAMDTTQAFMASEAGDARAIEEFVVAGASKRGWTTWLMGVVDDRVCAIIPIVIDAVNVLPSLEHHRAVYGNWAPSFESYTSQGVLEKLHTPEFRAVLKLIDPYEYRNELAMPKYMINATGDQLFVPDSSQFYFPDLVGEKHLRYVPNIDHYVDETESVQAMHHLILLGRPRPEMTWSVTKNDQATIRTNVKPSKVSLWQANNPAARDFRLETIGPAWTEENVPLSESGKYVVPIPRASKGWTASFVEFHYELGVSVPFVITTEVFVRPQQ